MTAALYCPPPVFFLALLLVISSTQLPGTRAHSPDCTDPRSCHALRVDDCTRCMRRSRLLLCKRLCLASLALRIPTYLGRDAARRERAEVVAKLQRKRDPDYRSMYCFGFQRLFVTPSAPLNIGEPACVSTRRGWGSCCGASCRAK